MLCAASDRACIEKMLLALNAELKKSGRMPLTLAEENIPGDGGFLLRSRGYDKNCSFEAMLREVRAAEESRVAAILFG